MSCIFDNYDFVSMIQIWIANRQIAEKLINT